MRTTYILDTNVLITDPNACLNFKDGDIILPITVLDELDKLKKLSNEAGRNARVATKNLDQISNQGDITLGVLLSNDILIKIDASDYDIKGNALYGDTRILSCAQAHAKNGNVVLVSNDINMRIRAKALGLMTQSYEKKQDVSELYSGTQIIHNDDALDDLLTNGSIHAASYDIKLNPNECVVFLDELGNEMAKARQIGKSNLKILKKSYPWGISPRNSEQEFAIDMLMDPKLPLVTLIGTSGCGKSLIALACALELVLEGKKKYDKLIVYRPIQPMGNDIGYMPGTEQEKLNPWFQAIDDNLEVLFKNKSKNSDWKIGLEMYKKKGQIEFGALTYIRGRSIPNALILLDEAQNLNQEEIKAILTRAGEGSKILLTGDIEQIDTKNLDAMNNGLSYVIDRFKNSELAGHVTFIHGERSKLATKAAEIL